MKSEIPEKGKRIKATLKTNKSKWLFGYYDKEQFVAFLDWTSMIEGKPTFYKWSDVEQWLYVKKARLIPLMFIFIVLAISAVIIYLKS